MKVSGFVGSPRKKGNSDILVDTFLAGAETSGAETEKFFLHDYNINQCSGCFRNCMVKPGTKCAVHRDDMDILINELISSDLVIFASPLYCGAYTAIMAKFFERCLPLWEVEIVGEMGTMDAIKFINNPAKGKKAVIALVQDFKDPKIGELAFKVFEHNVGGTFMMEIVEKIHITDVRDIGDMKKDNNRLDEIYNIGNRISRTIVR